jgi:hypothetical protein
MGMNMKSDFLIQNYADMIASVPAQSLGYMAHFSRVPESGWCRSQNTDS